MTLADWKTVAEIAQSAVTIAAIAVGGLWTYFLFIRNRLDYPKVQISMRHQQVLLPHGKRLIHAVVHIENVGKVVVKSSHADLRLRSVVPLPPDVVEAANDGFDPVHEGATEIGWPLIAGRNWNWKEGEFEIEPEEDDTLHADFVIDQTVSVVEFYCYLNNTRKTDLGWSETLVYALDKEENAL